MTEGYPFIFQMNDKTGQDKVLEYTLQYRFRSTKSNHTYVNDLSLYILANKASVIDMEAYVQKVIDCVADAMRH